MGACPCTRRDHSFAEAAPTALRAPTPAEATGRANDKVPFIANSTEGHAAATPAPGEADVAVKQLVFNVVLSSGKSFTLAAEATDAAVVLMRGLAAVHEVPPACNVKMFQSGQLLLEDAPVSGIDTEQPLFAVISRETKVEILLQAAGSYHGYAELLRLAQADPAEQMTRHVGPLPSILHVLEELGGQPPQLDTLRVGASGSGLEFTGNKGELILPSLDATPLLEAVGAKSFARATVRVEINSDAQNNGLGVVVEASPLVEGTVDESGIPSYIYNGYGVTLADKKQNAVKFHPGMHGGKLRVEGVGGWGNQELFTPKGWTQSGNKYHTLAITVGADGLNTVELSGADPGQIWRKSFRRQLTEGKHVPALYAWLDLVHRDTPPVHIGEVSMSVHLA